jgi:hypothetical protein
MNARKTITSVLVVAGALGLLSACGKSDEKAARNMMSKAVPQAKWGNDLTTSADITCDGQPEIISVGHAEDAIWVGVVEKSKIGVDGAPVIVRFPFGAEPGSFCSKPKRIDKSQLVCTNEGGTLPGCKPINGCQQITLVEDECGSFHFYWDNDRNSLTWWRR